MKKVIGGKTYNTDTAKLIADWSNGCYTTDLDYVSETLYVTRKGRFFIYGDGGPRSRYHKYYPGDNSWVGAEDIIPVTRDEAWDWILDHANDADIAKDMVAKYFADKMHELGDDNVDADN